MPIPAGVLLGSGLALAAVTGMVPLFFGGQVFQSAIIEFTLPVLGHVKFVTATIFDIGVYLVVVGLVIDVLRSLGSEVDRRHEVETTALVEAEKRRREARAGLAAATSSTATSSTATTSATGSPAGTTTTSTTGSTGAAGTTGTGTVTP
jgi:multicomponent Na+:H+ antiporter subunit A